MTETSAPPIHLIDHVFAALAATLVVVSLGAAGTAFVEGHFDLFWRAVPLSGLVALPMLIVAVASHGWWRVNAAWRGRLHPSLELVAGLVPCFALAVVAFRGLAWTFGIEQPFPLGFVAASLLTYIAARFGREWTGFDEPLALLPGFAVGLGLTAWVESAYALTESMTRPIFDPNALLLTAVAGLGIALGPAFAGLTRVNRLRRHRVLGVVVLVCALGLIFANRFVLVPRLYHFVHIALAFYELLFVAGALGCVLLQREAMGRTPLVLRATVVLVAVLVGASFLPDRRGAQHIDVTAGAAGLLLRPLADLDGDGFSAVWAGGADADDSDASVHPFARETSAESDANGNGESGFSPPPISHPPGPDASDLVVVITIDMLRPDFLQPYGAEEETSPNLLALAAESIVYERAYSAGGITTLSLPSLLRGRYPMALEMEPVYRTTARRYRFPEEVGPDDRPNRVFRSARPDTSATIGELFGNVERPAYAVLDDGPARVFQKGLGYEAGFARIWYPNDPEGPGEAEWGAVTVTDTVVELVRDAPRGAFLWVHYYDPHAAHPPCRRFEPTPGLGCYRDAIRDVDEQIGRIIEAMRQAGRWDNSAIFVSSDHGEALGEHGLSHHGLDSFEEFVRIPLIARWPGVSAGRDDRPVSLLDVSWSSVALAGAKPPESWHGAPLWSSQRRYPVLSQTMLTAVDGTRYRQQTLLVEGTRRTMWDRVSGRWWSYDLSSDPEQRAPLELDGAWRDVARWVDTVEREE